MPNFRINQKTLIVKLVINVVPWFIAAFAVFYVKVYLYSIVAILNIVLGSLVIFFHISGNPTVCMQKWQNIFTQTNKIYCVGYCFGSKSISTILLPISIKKIH